MTNVEQLKQSIIDADKIREEIEGEGVVGATKRKVEGLITAALKEGTPTESVINDGLIAGMEVVGARFKKNEIYIPEVLLAARAMKMGMDILKPEIIKAGIKPIGKCLVGTVQGDLHDIGKNLVAMMLKGAGFEVVDLGVDVGSDKFVEQAKTQGVQVVGMSTLLTTTMPAIEQALKAIKDAGVLVKIMIGGAPVTQDYADKIGADGYAPDAASAVDLAKSLLS
ncbi:MAG: cobalamin-binding protein [Phycisphaerae bacterium]|nr:cobalamin-binding protein [Phycisphaerae bacterium]NIP54067.1 cobalamin-binding protein [Phycisphaerae bacterium]NIS50924.1 cobalamin-binding protein [Phycisphaerae bacterium]NIU11879.1 cobalamin-binding protein [Phycisphaerae bacterium]NIU56168.1 cobalamin-binding protein [Phycisphaerae bacterium]